MNELKRELRYDLIKPSAKSIGTNLGLMVDGFMGWLGVWGKNQQIKQQKYAEDFKNKMESNVSNIKEENLKEPNMSIIGPALESSRFFYEESYYRELFSNLVASACDKSKESIIHPSYVEIIKQLSPMDAKLLSMFKHKSTYPIAEIQSINKDTNIVTPCVHCLFDFNNNDFKLNEHFLLTSSLVNLIRLGLIIKNSKILEKGYDYNQFKNNLLYRSFENTTEKIELFKYRLELTPFGKNFLSVCYDTEK